LAAGCILLIIRVFLIFQIPFTDTTEARYAEMARKMVETNDWITPQYDYAIPFWGKPPLHTWMSAIGMKIFGVNEFGARIFIFLSSLALLALLFRWVHREKGYHYALAGTLIVASNILYLLASATVMTDLVMTVGTTLCMVAFWDSLNNPHQKPWRRYLFFIGLAIGLLAKGPVATVITAFPIGLWVLLNNKWVDTWKRIPWLTGGLLTLALTAPWYIMAEIKTPGFLEYFIVGEHFHRFIDSGWTGDLYGHAHSHPKGTIWLYALSVLLPWTPFLLVPLIVWPKKLITRIKEKTNRSLWLTYLIGWAISPLFLFTMAGNILQTYLLPGIPAVGFIAIELWILTRKNCSDSDKATTLMVKFYAVSMAIAVLLMLATLWVITFHPKMVAHKSQIFVIQEAIQQRGGKIDTIYYYGKRYYSAEFYNQGKIKILEHTEELSELLSNGRTDYIVIRKKRVASFPPELLAQFTLVKSLKKMLLYSTPSNPPHTP